MASEATLSGVTARRDAGVPATALPAAASAAEDTPAWWPSLAAALQADVGAVPFATWLRDLRPGARLNNRVSVTMPTLFMADFVQREYGAALGRAAAAVLGAGLMVEVRAAGDEGAGEAKEAAGSAEGKGEAASAGEGRAGARHAAAGDESGTEGAAGEAKPGSAGVVLAEASPLDARLSFEHFVPGNNQFGYAAAQAVAQRVVDDKVGRDINPLFIYGGVGLGKTHLMQAVGHEVRARTPGKHIIYLTAEQFLFRFIRALRDKKTIAFKELFRSVDLLMIDDVQFIVGKDNTQEEFFHTFNTLVAMGKQIILTADRSPHDLVGLDERLRSRLAAGLPLEMHAPTVETRLAILTRKAEERGLELPAEVAQLLAERIASNVRELEGALNRLVAFSQLTGMALTVAFAREQLKDLLRVQIKTIGIEDIQQAAAAHFNVRLAEILGPRRTKDIVLARQTAQYLCKQLTTKSYPDIGRAFGGRDHTTVIHAVRHIEDLLVRDAGLREATEILTRQLKAH
jgi:chromosomal replication initiator protein